ncbi:MAG TPA: uracil-DNA glycosylase [Candidatus Babeliales bacterium]|jgi:uracil-DNA glycosylase family 4|nr:uracil-DNA glycosylase [Candidatus Babeliales bacterium]
MNQKKSKSALLEKLYEPYKKCISCPLGTLGRQTVVFGQGNPDARLMIIGEAPGRDEDEQGVPFIGRSGKFLTKILTSLGIDRKELFITNSVKCRPPQNRKPTFLESKTCKDLLLINQINIIKPKVICTLGSAAIETLLEKPVKINTIHGTQLSFGSITIIPTYHPAYVMRNQKKLDLFMKDLYTAYSICNL